MKVITKGVMTMGILVIIVSIIQWFFKYPDMSQFLFGCGIGSIICVLAYIYEWMKLKDKYYSKDEERISELEFWAINKGFKKK
jgi:FtsH-binding integral membrane protein